MYNSDKYHFADFTRNNYKRILKLTKESYQFRQFTDPVDSENIVIWRHDVDYSPQAALKLANIEAEESIKSTYFFLLHSEYYNLFETENAECVNGIINCGHEIGLHFDSGFYNTKNETDLEKYLKTEADFLNSVFNIEIQVFSFHNPFEFELSCKKKTYSGLLNTYADFFHSSIAYCSDSNGYWRHERLEDIILNKKYSSIQVLTHPEWWTDEIMSPRQRVWRCIEGRSEKLKINYDAFLKTHKRENIDW